MTIENIEHFIQERKELLLADLAIHLMVDLGEAKTLVEPLIQTGKVKQVWQPRKTIGCKLCGCDNEEYLHWVEN